MTKNNERLFEEFKQVDMICGDMFSCQHGISQYISEMEQIFPDGRQRVSSWETDYRNLKHIRWLRNQIAHEISAENCSMADVEWLEQFHRRILNGQDPLAVLRRAEQSRPGHRTRPDDARAYTYYIYQESRERRRSDIPVRQSSMTAAGKKKKKPSGGLGKFLGWVAITAVLIAIVLFFFSEYGVMPR